MLLRIPADELIAQASAEIDAIKTAAGFREVHFNHLCMPVLRAFAHHVQLLPLSKDAYCDAGGAWQFGLTASTVALRYAETQLFYPRMESEERRKIEPQCRFAAYAAVLSSVVAMLAQNAHITSGGNADDEYHPLVSPRSLYTFLEMYPGAKLAWRTDGHVVTAAEGAAIAARFIPTGLLSQFDIRIAQMIVASIAPQATPNGLETTLAKVVRVSLTKVIERYLQQDAARVQTVNGGVTKDANGAQSIADALIASTRPREITNPLDPAIEPSANAKPVIASPVPSPATTAAIPANTSAMTADALLAAATPVLRDWFAALKRHERYSTLKTHLVVTERGIEVPISMLGFFGVNGPTIKKMMTDAGMVVDRSADHRSIILQPSLNSLLFGE